eukprot:GHVT01096821.1.p2 GENE.GHVT01096821.1~~GHVT01096821.1.p2  ORF type:complete len:117 (-),score=6.53 GHVT01096821.1:1883-2233(-)
MIVGRRQPCRLFGLPFHPISRKSPRPRRFKGRRGLFKTAVHPSPRYHPLISLSASNQSRPFADIAGVHRHRQISPKARRPSHDQSNTSSILSLLSFSLTTLFFFFLFSLIIRFFSL